MALNVVSKINTRQKSLYRKNRFLSPQLRRLLCNAFIQPHFDYACSVCYPNLNKKFKTKLQTLQNKCVRFCLQLDNKAHVGITEFKQINWLPVNYRFRQCLAANVFKFFDDKCPLYMKGVYEKSCISQASTRSSTMKLSKPLRRTNNGQHFVFVFCFFVFLFLFFVFLFLFFVFLFLFFCFCFVFVFLFLFFCFCFLFCF